MYVEIEVRSKKLKAMVDMEANTIYIVKALVDETPLPYKKDRHYVKGVNTKSPPLYGVARDTNIQIGPWKGKVDIIVPSLVIESCI